MGRFTWKQSQEVCRIRGKSSRQNIQRKSPPQPPLPHFSFILSARIEKNRNIVSAFQREEKLENTKNAKTSQITNKKKGEK